MTQPESSALRHLNLGSYEGYMRWAYTIPVLSIQEEKELVAAWVEKADVEAARKLVYAHLRYVVSVARGFATYGLPMADLVSEGTVGLMKAVKRFDPKHGVRLVTFAMHWVKSEICEYITRNISLVRIATTQKKARLLRVLSKIKKEQESHQFSFNQAKEIAADLDMLPADVEKMHMHMSGRNVSIEDADANFQLPASEKLATTYEAEDWAIKRQQALQKAMAQLNERERQIVVQRWLVDDKATLQALAELHNISLERVRQIEAAALKKLKKLLPQVSNLLGS